MDLALNKKYISEDIIKDDIRTEAYLLWSKKEDTKSFSEKEDIKSDTGGLPSVIFTKKAK